MEKTLKEYSLMANRILNNKTRYSSNKKIINSFFKESLKKGNIDIVKYRLTIIDSYYSTQMSKRLYGIEDLAEKISSFSDNELKNEISLFLSTPQLESNLSLLLYDSYGINKEGKPFGKATSLISKYLYFLNDNNFPIYDSLAFTSSLFISSKRISISNYFLAMKELNESLGINNYEELDNLLWLIGKIKTGSFSILMDAEKYKEIIYNDYINEEFKKINQSNKKNKSFLKDEVIRDFIKKNYRTATIFSTEEKEFFDFTFSLEKI